MIKYGYGSIPINTIFRGMNIHKSQLFDVNYRGTIGFDTLPYDKMWRISSNDAIDQTWGHTDLDEVSGPGCAPWCFFGCQQGPLAMNMW